MPRETTSSAQAAAIPAGVFGTSRRTMVVPRYMSHSGSMTTGFGVAVWAAEEAEANMLASAASARSECFMGSFPVLGSLAPGG